MMKIIQWNVADKEGGINEVIKGEKKAFLFLKKKKGGGENGLAWV